jgi:hypothetical protein
VDLDKVDVEIPFLKYNKKWLFMLTQDDCKQAAFAFTWAAFNGWPVPNFYGDRLLYYNYVQGLLYDIPPSATKNRSPMVMSDGAGNDVRFSFLTTLFPQASWINAYVNTNLTAPSTDRYRFYMKSGLVWGDIIGMVNYDTDIAFHDVDVTDVNDVAQVQKGYTVVQDSVLKRLSGRGMKVLAEPNGNKTYLHAAENYAPIQISTAQTSGDGITTVKLKPFQIGDDDLKNKTVERWFPNAIADVQTRIDTELAKPVEERSAIFLGVHGTDPDWVAFWQTLSDNYGRAGDDSMWFVSYEQYYEYNYNRVNAVIRKEIDGNTLRVTVEFPGGEYFYYPSTTLNLVGLDAAHVQSVTSNDAVTGLSFAGYDEGYMLNIDCRKGLATRAEHFTQQYETEDNSSLRTLYQRDALYFTNMLKDGDTKTSLLNRLGK